MRSVSRVLERARGAQGAFLLCVVSAVLLPLAVALVFGHPVRRVIVPESAMLAIVTVLTLLGGVVPGLIAVVSATISLWFFSFPPGLSFRADDPQDIVAAVFAGAIASGLVLLLNVVERRQQREVARHTRLTAEVGRQRETISVMQRAILPEQVPATPGTTLGWHYTPGGEPSAPVGGDWFAFIPVSPTCLGVAIGDVAGHGVGAVASMAEYRYGLRTLAAQGCGPAATLGTLDNVTHLFNSPYYSTCVYGLIDVAGSQWTYSCAGHPPPLLVRDGEARALRAPHGPPVGAGLLKGEYMSEAVELRKDDVLVLYTDGLIERRGESIELGIKRLADYMSKSFNGEDLFDVCTEVVRHIAGPAPEDDVALVLVRYEEAA